MYAACGVRGSSTLRFADLALIPMFSLYPKRVVFYTLSSAGASLLGEGGQSSPGNGPAVRRRA
jgi:hypothetical protein